ncbi:hypothetical protein HU200_007036 [Digitaria exilis]|uniref:Uncharacterized protein n=1 Tax=Digitaria exilis TaxID=1010633 RepID=A0A835FRG0_9POAL|nr:hypothetical protein HU200_007036 [Digitaria exilis]
MEPMAIVTVTGGVLGPVFRSPLAYPARRRLLPAALRLPPPPTAPPRQAGQGAVEQAAPARRGVTIPVIRL